MRRPAELTFGMRLSRPAQWSLSVRARLVAYAFLCAVPLLLLTFLQIRRDSLHLHHHAAESAQVAAERLELRMDQVLGGAESVAHAIGALGLTRGEASARCSLALARALLAAGPYVRNFSLSSPSGDLLCSARMPREPLNISDRLHFRQAVELRRPTLSGVTLARVVGRHALLLAVPIVGGDGEVAAVATAVIDGAQLTQDLGLPSDVATVATLFDAEGRLVSRWPADAEQPLGAPLRDTPLVSFALANGDAQAELVGPDGHRRHYVTRRVIYRGDAVLWVAAGVDVDALEAMAQAARWRELFLVLLVAASVVAVAVAATRPVVLARVRNLLEVAGQVAQGRHGSRVPVAVQDELTPVELALNRMLDAVEADRAVLEPSENRYRMLFEHSLDGVLQLDGGGRIVAANPAACRILGRSESQLCGLHRSRLLDAQDPRGEHLLQQGLGQVRGEATLLRGDGSRIEVALACSVYRDAVGGEHTCIVLHDVSEQKAMQQRVLRLNRELEARVAQRTHQLQAANRELEAFSYSVSHDLRAPVAVVRSFAEVLEESGAVQGDKPLHYLRRIRAAGQQMNDLIDGLLALARISRSQLEWSVVDLSAMAREVAHELAEAQPRPVRLDVAEGMHAMGDARLLRVVLHNLVGNAIKFSSRTPAPHVAIGFAPSTMGEQVFCVRDNGEGFDPAQAHRLFVAFQRLHRTDEYPGVGVGLATVQRIVQRHGGRIWAEARPGNGAAFYFVLGAPDTQPPSPPPPSSVPSGFSELQ